MGNLTTALLVVLSVSVMLILGGLVATDLAGEDKTLMNCTGSILEEFDSNSCSGTYILNTSNPTGRLPSTNLNPVTATGITGEEGIFSSFLSWLSGVTGFSYIYGVLSAPSTFLKNVGVPSGYADLIAVIWYGVVLFLIISWLKGQDI